MTIATLVTPLIVILIGGIIKILFSLHKGNKGIKIILAAMLFIVAYNLFVIYGHQLPALANITDRLTYTDAIIFYLLIPLFYILLLKITLKRPIYSVKNALHIWPILPGLLFSVNFHSLSFADQKAVVLGKSCGILPDWMLYVFGAFSVLFYLFLSLRLLYIYNKKHENILTLHSAKQISAYVWILYLCLILCICFGILTLGADTTSQIHNILVCLLICLAAIVLFIVFYIKPETLEHIKDNYQTTNIICNEKGIVISEEKTFQSEIQLIENVIIQNKIYLLPNANVDDISVHTNIPATKVTSIIKAEYAMSVSGFINTQRIIHAKKLLEQSELPKIDILAYDSGFSTRSTFYACFKKHTGMTPMEYRKQFFKT